MRARTRSLGWLLLLAACAAPRGAQPPEVVEPREPLPPVQHVSDLRGRVLVVDPGHGGRDPGAVAVDGTREKHVNAAIAELLVRELTAAGATVHTTRDTDVYVSLEERAALATQTRCDLFVSIHADAAERAEARGATVFLARGALAGSVRAGEAIAARLTEAGIEVRGVRRAGFRVLVGHPRPSVLVECGFLTNDAERARLLDAGVRRTIARAIAAGTGDALGKAP